MRLRKEASPILDRKIIRMEATNRSAYCKEISSSQAVEGISFARGIVNEMLLMGGLKEYRLRKKLRLTKEVKQKRLSWDKNHIE